MPRPHNLLALAALLLSLVQPSPAQASLPDIISRAAQESGIPPDAISVWAGPVSGNALTLQHNAGQAMNPASVMKLLTSYAALDQFGPAWTWNTNAYLQGRLHDGILDGDLLIVGSGDPDLTRDRLQQWLRDWRAHGLRQIRGNILIDTHLYAPQPPAPAFDAAPQRAYNAQASAFLVNFGAITLHLRPGSTGQAPAVLPLTPAAPLVLINHLRSSAGACGDWRNAIAVQIAPKDKGLSITLSGPYAATCGERDLNLNAGDSLRWAGMVIRAEWEELGGNWTGKARAGAHPADTLPVFSSWHSAPLPEVLRDMNKWSNNVMARQVFLMQAQSTDATTPATPERSATALHNWQLRQGLEPAQWILENGSGLSRIERTTAEQLGNLLKLAWRSPRMPEFVSTLPVLGMDGTMRNRLTASPLAGRAYIKSGTLDNVKSAAGYLLDSKGQWQAFAILINHPRAEAGDAILNNTLLYLYNHD